MGYNRKLVFQRHHKQSEDDAEQGWEPEKFISMVTTYGEHDTLIITR